MFQPRNLSVALSTDTAAPGTSCAAAAWGAAFAGPHGYACHSASYQEMKCGGCVAYLVFEAELPSGPGSPAAGAVAGAKGARSPATGASGASSDAGSPRAVIKHFPSFRCVGVHSGMRGRALRKQGLRRCQCLLAAAPTCRAFTAQAAGGSARYCAAVRVPHCMCPPRPAPCSGTISMQSGSVLADLDLLGLTSGSDNASDNSSVRFLWAMVVGRRVGTSAQRALEPRPAGRRLWLLQRLGGWVIQPVGCHVRLLLPSPLPAHQLTNEPTLPCSLAASRPHESPRRRCATACATAC